MRFNEYSQLSAIVYATYPMAPWELMYPSAWEQRKRAGIGRLIFHNKHNIVPQYPFQNVVKKEVAYKQTPCIVNGDSNIQITIVPIPV